MKRSVRFNNTAIPILASCLIIVGILAGTALAETIEMVTYYPTASNTGDIHATSLTVGNDYLNTIMDNGQALIQTSLGIGPGFGNRQPAAPTLLQVQGVAGQASQALFLPGAGGTMSVDVAGDLFVRQTDGSGNYVRIRAASDANIGIELRSETLSGLPYIDFANDAATNFDMRIQMTGNDNLSITGGSLTVDGSETRLTAWGWERALMINADGALIWDKGPSQNYFFMAYPSAGPPGDFFAGLTSAIDGTTNPSYVYRIIGQTKAGQPAVGTFQLFTNLLVGPDNFGLLPPAPNELAVGNLYANDLFLRSTGQWASQAGSGPNSRSPMVVGAAAAATGTIGSQGYERLPGGLIVQYATIQLQDPGSAHNIAPQRWTFPIAFPNGVLSVTTTNLAHMAGQTGSPSLAAIPIIVAVSTTSVQLDIHNTFTTGTKAWVMVQVLGY